MTNKTIWPLLVLTLVATLLAAISWFHLHHALADVRAEVVATELHPISMLLAENQSLINELQAQPFGEKDSGILDAYLAKIRRDGVAKHVDMKQRLDTLADNNTAVVTLIKVYSSHAKTSKFSVEGDKFRNYASAWRDRWNSVMEIFMAGGTYAASGVVFPNDFPAAVDAEIDSLK